VKGRKNAGKDARREKLVSSTIHLILSFGAVGSFALLLLGAIILFLPGFLSGESPKLLHYAILFLLLVPMARVVAVMIGFGTLRNKAYFLTSVMVLVTLGVTLLFGFA
jgi:hypothetical protein